MRAEYPPTRRRQGFTLIEVLVAVAVLAIALGALTKSASDNARNAVYLQERTFAHWVAMNKATEMQISDVWPDTGSANGTSELADRRWHWQSEVETTPEPDLRRVEMSVAPADDKERIISRVTFFVRKPLNLAETLSGGR